VKLDPVDILVVVEEEELLHIQQDLYLDLFQQAVVVEAEMALITLLEQLKMDM
jgi:hypothetical protein